MAAHEGLFEERLHQLNKIVSRLKFQNNIKVLKHDDIIIAGDMNFRLPRMNDTNEIMERIKNWQEYSYDDELRNFFRRSEKAHHFISKFNEHELDYPPTFKYFIGEEKNERTGSQIPPL